MSDNWQRYLDIAGDVTRELQHRAEAVVKVLVQQGETASDRAEQAVDDLLAGSEAQRKAVARLVAAETERVVARLGLVPQAEVDELRAEVERLRGQVAASGGPSAPAAPAAPARAPRKSPAAKRAAAAERAAAVAASGPATGESRTAPRRTSAAKPKPKPKPKAATGKAKKGKASGDEGSAAPPAPGGGSTGPEHGPEAVATGAAAVGESRRRAAGDPPPAT